MDQERAKEIVKSIFAEKLKQKEEEVELISERIKEVQKALQLVRYGAVTTISNQTQIYVSFHQIDWKNYKFLIFLTGTSKRKLFPFNTSSCLRFNPR